jgi:hypothetical protein
MSAATSTTGFVVLAFYTHYTTHTDRDTYRFNPLDVSSDVRLFLHNLRTGYSIHDTEASLFTAAMVGELHQYITEEPITTTTDEMYHLHRSGE